MHFLDSGVYDWYIRGEYQLPSLSASGTSWWEISRTSFYFYFFCVCCNLDLISSKSQCSLPKSLEEGTAINTSSDKRTDELLQQVELTSQFYSLTLSLWNVPTINSVEYTLSTQHPLTSGLRDRRFSFSAFKVLSYFHFQNQFLLLEEIEPRTMGMPGRHAATEPHLKLCFQPESWG